MLPNRVNQLVTEDLESEGAALTNRRKANPSSSRKLIADVLATAFNLGRHRFTMLASEANFALRISNV